MAVAFGGDVRARSLVKDDQRHAILAGHVGEEETLEPLLRADVGGAATDGEVLAADDHAPPVDHREAADVGQRLEVDELAVLVLAVTGEPADLVEAARVGDRVDALADRELAELVLAADALLTAHLQGKPSPLVQLVELRLPISRRID